MNDPLDTATEFHALLDCDRDWLWWGGVGTGAVFTLLLFLAAFC